MKTNWFMLITLQLVIASIVALSNPKRNSLLPLNINNGIEKIVQDYQTVKQLNHPNATWTFQIQNLKYSFGAESLEAFYFLSVNISKKCSKQLFNFMRALKNKDYWAFKVLDSYGKPSSGILQGSLLWNGEYSECLNSTEPSLNWTSKYCSLVKNRQPTAIDPNKVVFPFTIGLCLPKDCDNNDIITVLNFVQKQFKPNSSEFESNDLLCVEEKTLDSAAIVAICVLSSVVGIVLSATLFHLIKIYATKRVSEIETRNVLTYADDNSVTSINQAEVQTLINPNATNIQSESRFCRLLTNMSLVTSVIKVFNTNIGESELRCLHAIRFISLSWVILGHSYGFLVLFSDNPIVIGDLLKRFSFQIISNGFFSVDTFFLLSGLLTSYLFLKELSKSGKSLSFGFMAKYYVHRFWRLSPPYWLVLFFSIALTKYIGSGPFFPPNGFENDLCKTNWWYNFLYINNFLDPNESCFPISWYLANDMQFHWLAPVFLIPLYFRKIKTAYFLALLMLIGNIVSISLLLYYNPDSEQGIFGPQSFLFSKWIYFKPWARIGPFVIGLLVGYILHSRKNLVQIKIKPVLNCSMFILSMIFCSICVFGLYPDMRNFPLIYLPKSYHIIYQSLSRIIWGLAVGLLILVCEAKSGGIIKKILALNFWIPLSRLSYSAYLIHTTIMFYFYSTQEHPFHIQDLNLIYYFVSNWVFSYVAGFFVSIFFELPWISLEKFILG